MAIFPKNFFISLLIEFYISSLYFSFTNLENFFDKKKYFFGFFKFNYWYFINLPYYSPIHLAWNQDLSANCDLEFAAPPTLKTFMKSVEPFRYTIFVIC